MEREDYRAGRAKSVSQKLRAEWKDYSQVGWYFVTLSANYHRHLFGAVVDGEMRKNELGKVVEEQWLRTAEIRDGIRLGAFQVMPNHFHGLIYLKGGKGARPLGLVIKAFKGAVVREWGKRIALPCERTGASHGNGKGIALPCERTNGNGRNEEKIALPCERTAIWQPNYWDVICLGENELAQKEVYIRANPLRWALRDVPYGMMKTSAFRGHAALRNCASFYAVRISRKASVAEIHAAIAKAKVSSATCVSTFISLGERAVLDALLETPGVKILWLSPVALPEHIPVKWGKAFAENRALWIAPFPQEVEMTRQNCEGCNQLAKQLCLNRG